MPNMLQFAGQGVVFAIIAAAVGYVSALPIYRQFPEGQAQIKLALQHGGARVEDCRKLTREELSKLPSTERRPNTCSRERVPLSIELSIDGARVTHRGGEPQWLFLENGATPPTGAAA